MAALAFALDMPGAGYNAVLTAADGTDAFAAFGALVAEVARNRLAGRSAAGDLLCVWGRSDGSELDAVVLPAGRGREFADALAEAMRRLSHLLVASFGGELYAAERRAIDDRLRAVADEAVALLSERAATQNIALLRTPTGYVLAPMHEGEVVKRETFAGLPASYREDVAARIETLQLELTELVAARPAAEAERASAIVRLDTDEAQTAVTVALAPMRAAFADVPAALDSLDRVAGALRDAIADARALGAADGGALDVVARLPAGFAAHVLCERPPAAAAPVVTARSLSPSDVFGRVTARDAGRAPQRPGAMIHAGLLHRASGGCLIADAAALAREPETIRALSRALALGTIVVPDHAAAIDALPLDVKIILLGNGEVVAALRREAPDLMRHFKVEAQLDGETPRTADVEDAYARRIAWMVAASGLRAVTRAASERIVDEMGSLGSDPGSVSLDLQRLADLLREADHFAAAAGRDLIEADDVERACDGRIARVTGIAPQGGRGGGRA